ncbi:low temperature requirement protein A [Streptomyces sp. NPDC054945]
MDNNSKGSAGLRPLIRAVILRHAGLTCTHASPALARRIVSLPDVDTGRPSGVAGRSAGCAHIRGEPRMESEHRVSTPELFFDLVFVFTIRQLTVLPADDLSPRGARRSRRRAGPGRGTGRRGPPLPRRTGGGRGGRGSGHGQWMTWPA